MKKILYLSLFVIVLLFLGQNSGFAQDDKKIYNFVSMEKPPTFPGGITEFYKFLGQKVRYPKLAAENNIQGTVKISFTIEKDGTISDIEVPEKIGWGLDEEAIRVMRLSPKWIPGMHDGKLVRVKYNIPIKFSLGPRTKS